MVKGRAYLQFKVGMNRRKVLGAEGQPLLPMPKLVRKMVGWRW